MSKDPYPPTWQEKERRAQPWQSRSFERGDPAYRDPQYDIFKGGDPQYAPRPIDLRTPEEREPDATYRVTKHRFDDRDR